MSASDPAETQVRRFAARVKEPGGFILLSLFVAGFYVVLRAGVLDPPTYIDPWIYTAAFTNYHYLLHTYPGAYYLARLPWIIPGIAANSVLAPVPAFFVLHAAFFFGAGLFAYLLFRRFMGPGPALIGYAALMLTPLFFDAYSNDYPDGAILTYLFGGVYFALGAWRSRRRVLRFVLAGFFLAAAVGTNLFTVVTVGGVVLLYLVVFSVEPRFWRNGLRDVTSAVLGAGLLVAGCGAFSEAQGGPFLFFMPQVNEARAIHTTDYKAHGYEWMKSEPQLLLPLFAVALLVPLLAPRLRRDWRADTAVRFAAGSGLLLAYLTTVIGVWEFADNGDFLETTYYFSVFNLGLALTLVSVVYLLTRDGGARSREGPSRPLIACGFVAAALPTFVFFRLHWWSFGEPGARVTIALMVAGLVIVAFTRLSFRRISLVAAPAAVMVVLFAANYAAASGLSTYAIFATTPSTFKERRGTLSLGLQLIRFMKQSGFQNPVAAYPGANPVPSFWYNAEAAEAFTGMNSMYLWAYTWAGLDMPHIDAAMRTLLDNRRPAVLVLFCLSRQCSGARPALAHAGYANKLLVERLLVSGGQRVWVAALQLLKFKAG